MKQRSQEIQLTASVMLLETGGSRQQETKSHRVITAARRSGANFPIICAIISLNKLLKEGLKRLQSMKQDTLLLHLGSVCKTKEKWIAKATLTRQRPSTAAEQVSIGGNWLQLKVGPAAVLQFRTYPVCVFKWIRENTIDSQWIFYLFPPVL